MEIMRRVFASTTPGGSCAADGIPQARDHAILIAFSQIVKQRQRDGAVLRGLALPQRSGGAPGALGVRGFSMHVHDAAPRRDARVEKVLHDGMLSLGRYADGERLPVGAGPLRF